MSTAPSPQQSGSSSHDVERRLWFDYLGRLNERKHQTSRESGATNWVLLGVAAAIVYKVVPQLPSVLPIPGVLKTALAILLLEINAVVFFGLALAFLLYFVMAGTEKRVVPDTERRVALVFYWIMCVATLLMVGSEFWLAVSLKGAALVRWVLVAFGVYWLVNIGAGINKRFRTAKEAKKRGASVPLFYGGFVDPELGALIAVTYHFVPGAIAVTVLWVFLRALNKSPVGWLVPLGAATHFLVLLGILVVLFYRIVYLAPKAAYESLERAMVLENLSPAEVKSRFVAQLLGSGIRDWLAGITKGMREASERLKNSADSIAERMVDIERIDPQYLLERQGRAKKLLDELQRARGEFMSAVQHHKFQFGQYPSLYHSREELEIWKAVLADLNVWLESEKANAASTGELL